MENFEIQKTITKCRLTAEQWGLLDQSDSNTAASAINEAVVDAFNDTSLNEDEKRLAVFRVMRKYKHTGALGKEAFDRLEAIFFEMK